MALHLKSTGIDFTDFSDTGSGDIAMSSELLDDYEEGSWTPLFNFDGTTTGVVYSGQVGKYVKVGKTVFVESFFQISNNGTGTGSANIDGLPFTVISDMLSWEPAHFGIVNFLTAVSCSGIWGWFNNNSTQIQLRTLAAGGSTGSAYPNHTVLADNAYISGSGTYRQA